MIFFWVSYQSCLLLMFLLILFISFMIYLLHWSWFVTSSFVAFPQSCFYVLRSLFLTFSSLLLGFLIKVVNFYLCRRKGESFVIFFFLRFLQLFLCSSFSVSYFFFTVVRVSYQSCELLSFSKKRWVFYHFFFIFWCIHIIYLHIVCQTVCFLHFL